MTSHVAVYSLQYPTLSKPLFLQLCEKHLANRLAGKAALIEKRRAFNKRCQDCEYSAMKGKK